MKALKLERNELPSHAPKKDHAKSVSYYQGLNHRLLNLVHPTATSILEVGCAEGNLGAEIKARTGARVTGIEFFIPAAEIAANKLDQVVIGDIEVMELDFALASFDHILFGDVLEHLKQPWDVLEKVKPYLKPGGSILTCIPNVGHISIIESLLTGKWTYTSAGLLDATHFRFFTIDEMHRMFHGAGYHIETSDRIHYTTDRYEQMIACLHAVNQSFGLLNEKFPEDARTYQYVIRAILR